jgi:hypothetical protein
VSPKEALEIFRALFADSFIGVPEFIRGHWCFVMEENAPEAKLRKMVIRDVPEGSLLLKMQQYPELRNIFKSTRGECKRCDYILLTPSGNDLYAIFIEMKSHRPDNRDPIPQFRGADCFMTYCRAVAEQFYDTAFSSCSAKKRFVLFYVNNANKKSFSPRPVRAVHSSPENMMKYPVGNKKTREESVFFKELI